MECPIGTFWNSSIEALCVASGNTSAVVTCYVMSTSLELGVGIFILRYMHGILNVDEKKLIVQLGEKSRNETFEPN